MQILGTAIGQRLTASRLRASIATVVACLIVGADLALVSWSDKFTTEGRNTLALLALAANVWLVQGDPASIGFVAPRQGWWYWIRSGMLIALAITLTFLLGFGAWVWSGREVPRLPVAYPSNIASDLLAMCLFAPLFEETIYRLAICVPLCASLGPKAAIVVSGLAFGGLHVLYGDPSPEQVLGGFVIAWAYLKSESILVPLMLHSLGNLFVLSWKLLNWYWVQGYFL